MIENMDRGVGRIVDQLRRDGRLGRTLEFDPATLSFPRDREANAMLTRDYRPPFVVPDKV